MNKKKIDKKNIIIIVLIIVTIIELCLLIEKEYKVDSKIENSAFTYLISKEDPTMDEELNYFVRILTFNEENICVDKRMVIDFKDEKRAQEEYDNLITCNEGLEGQNIIIFNIQKNGTKITCNSNLEVGQTKESFLETNAFYEF
jgi:hypothetical protein